MSGFFRMEIKVISRTSKNGTRSSSIKAAAYIDGKEYQEKCSSIEAASYISGDVLKDMQEESTVDYTYKKGVLFSNVVLPEHAPTEYKDPEILWNAVENVDCRKNATLFREWIACYDQHLSLKEMKNIAREFAESLASEGMVVHYAIHDEKNQNGNFHVHFLAPFRSIKEDGSFQKCIYKPRHYRLDAEGKKIPVIDKKTGLQKKNSAGRLEWKMERTEYVDSFNDIRLHNAERWRNTFAEIENKYLPEEYKVSPLSYETQRIDKVPAKHLGKAACAVQRRLEKQVSRLSEENREYYLKEILKEVQKEYRREYYGTSRKVHAIKVDAHEKKSDLRQSLQVELNRLYTYRPREEYVSFYTSYGRERLLLEWILLKLVKFIRYLIKKARWENSINLLQSYQKKLYQAETDLIIVYSYGLTAAIENHLLVGEYEMKQELLKEIGIKIKNLEAEIKDKKEDLEYERIEKELRVQQSKLEQLNSSALSGGYDLDLETTAKQLDYLSKELQAIDGYVERSSRITAKGVESSKLIRQRRVDETVLSNEKKIRI